MEYMESKMQEQYDAQNELIKEISRLQDLLAKHGICDDCGELYNHHFDEPLASCGCKQSEWYELTPHMKQVLELKAERDALSAQLYLAKNIFELLFSLPDADTREEISSEVDTWLQMKAVFDAAPQQCLREIEAKAGLVGWNACVDWLVENSSNLGWYSTYFTMSEFADKVRKGGAE